MLKDKCTGECHPCDETMEYDPTFDCAVAGEPHFVTGSCMCEYNQWYDMSMERCEDCKAFCQECSDDGTCLKCEEGYMFLKGYNCCYDTCATGLWEITPGNCDGHLGIVADFRFKCENATQNINWAYTSSWMDATNMTRSWTVKAIGGDDETGTMSDPYAVDDRGLWFDGRYSYLTIKGLTLFVTNTNIFWTKPHGDGTLFSNTIINGRYGHDIYIISIKGTSIQIDLTGPNWTFLPDADIVTSFLWQNLAVSAKWDEDLNETEFKIYRDNAILASAIYPKYEILDRPDWETSKLIGAYTYHETLRGMFCGYIWQY
jgi:hypothetical protein